MQCKDTPLGLLYHLTLEMQMAEKNMVQNAVQPNRNNDSDKNKWEEFDDEENTNDAEFQAINAQLDQLNSVLDSLEQKNDDIHAELIELLQSNREARKQFQESQQEQISEVEKPDA